MVGGTLHKQLDLLLHPVRQDAVFKFTHELDRLLCQGKSKDLLGLISICSQLNLHLFESG